MVYSGVIVDSALELLRIEGALVHSEEISVLVFLKALFFPLSCSIINIFINDINHFALNTSLIRLKLGQKNIKVLLCSLRLGKKQIVTDRVKRRFA